MLAINKAPGVSQELSPVRGGVRGYFSRHHFPSVALWLLNSVSCSSQWCSRGGLDLGLGVRIRGIVAWNNYSTSVSLLAASVTALATADIESRRLSSSVIIEMLCSFSSAERRLTKAPRSSATAIIDRSISLRATMSASRIQECHYLKGLCFPFGQQQAEHSHGTRLNIARLGPGALKQSSGGGLFLYFCLSCLG